MVKVLYVVDRLHRGSGVTTVVLNYLLHMDRSDIRIDVIALYTSDSDVVEELVDSGINVHFMPALSLIKIRSYWQFWHDFFQDNKYDIIHSHFNQIDYIVFSVGKHYGIKEFISHSHNTKLSEIKWKAIRNFIMCYPARKLATRWAACSDVAGVALFGKEFLQSEKSIRINNAVDCRLFGYDADTRSSMRKQYGLSDKIKVLACIGTFKVQKNQAYLLPILKELLSDDDNYRLIFVGGGNMLDEVKKKVDDMELSQYVIFAGVVSNVKDYYQMADVLLMPSLYEGLPMVGIEAQVSGLPCIFSDGITKEVNLNINSNMYLSLKVPAIKWIEGIKMLSTSALRQDSVFIKKCGYDIDFEAERLKCKYIGWVRSKNS